MYGILFDTTQCKGCERCIKACIEVNGADPSVAARDRATTRDGLSAERLLAVRPVDQGRFTRLSCMHCEEPSCVAACLVGGLRKSPQGPVLYDPEKCIGCRYCMLACPFHVPRYEWDSTAPFMRKCSMCFERLERGRIPACVEACPNEVMQFGDREELLARAHEILRKKPDRYLSRVWGENEFGGTSILFISDVDLSAVGWPAESGASIPSLTDPLIHQTPFIGLSVALGCWGLSAIIARRNKLMGGGGAEETDETSDAARGKDE
jgi:formate dehydrogenase iron-sulfur subunit